MIRDATTVYAETMMRLAEELDNIVLVEADLMKASGSEPFRNKFPGRVYNIGIAEQNLLGFAAGLAAVGKIPFASAIASFLSQRACDQAVISVAYNKYNVKMIGLMPGVTSEKNGGTHISVIDLAIMRSIPGIMVIDPGDHIEYGKALEFAARHEGPVYIRANRGKIRPFHDENYVFEPGKGQFLRRGSDVGLITTGLTTEQGIVAARQAEQAGIGVAHLHLPTLKPLDAPAIASCMEMTGVVITAENHSVIGGLGGAVTESLAATRPGKVVRLGFQDHFGETATRDYMAHKYGFDAEAILVQIKACAASK